MISTAPTNSPNKLATPDIPYIENTPHIQTPANLGKGPGLYPKDEAHYLRIYGTTDSTRFPSQPR